jgi:hypothetical protein
MVARVWRRQIFIGLALGVLGSCSKPAGPVYREVEWTSIREVGRGVFSRPGTPVLGFNALVPAGRGVYLYDSQGDYPFYAVDTRTYEVRGFGAWGDGPGALRTGLPVMLSAAGERIFAYAPLQGKLLVFSQDLALVREYGPAQGVPGLGTFYVVAETLAVFFGADPREPADALARLYRLGEAEIVPRPTRFGPYRDAPALEPLGRNPVLRPGPVHADSTGAVYWAHYLSSLRARFELDGTVRFLRSDPRNVPVPVAEFRESHGVVTGDPERATQSYVALATDSRYLYAVHSGVEITREQALAGGAARAELRLGEGQVVDVFEKSDGGYRFSLRLPVWATNLVIVRDRWYLLVLEDEPRLVVYEAPAWAE